MSTNCLLLPTKWWVCTKDNYHGTHACTQLENVLIYVVTVSLAKNHEIVVHNIIVDPPTISLLFV